MWGPAVFGIETMKKQKTHKKHWVFNACAVLFHRQSKALNTKGRCPDFESKSAAKAL
jgi:hypothetical protein